MSKKSNKLRRKLFRSLKRWLKNPFSYLLLLILALIDLATYVVYKTETKTDSGITGLFDAVWHTIVAVVAAYYDFYVKSVPGRFASLVLLLFGMALWAVIIGKITSVIMDIQSKNNRGLKKIRPMKGQFLLCGWKNGFEELLATVLRSNPDITPDMIVLVNNATETAWFGRLVNSASAVVFPSKRIKFQMPDGKTGSPLQGQAFLYLGSEPHKFLAHFREFGWGAIVEKEGDD